MSHLLPRVKEIQPRVIYVREPTDGSDSSDANESSEDEEEMRFLQTVSGPDVPSEYWHIQKLIKYIKVGDQTATNAALSVLRDHDLKAVMSQNAIRDIGGLEILVNLLETNHHRCKSGSLAIMNEIADNPLMRRDLTNLGVIPMLVTVVGGQSRDLQILAAECIAKIARVRTARRFVRKCNGIPKLIALLEVSDKALSSPLSSLKEDQLEEVEVVRAAAKALWTLTLSPKNRTYIMRSGCIQLLAKAARSVHIDVVLPVVGTLQECANEIKYQIAIQTAGVVVDLVRYLTHSNEELVKQSARAICKTAAVYEPTRDQIRNESGLEPLVNLLKNKTMRENKPLMAAATGAIWKCALSPENVRRFNDIRTVEILVGMLVEDDEEVLANTAGALAEMCKLDENRTTLRIAGGLPKLVALLSQTSEPMLANVARVLGECADNAECMLGIEELDGVRLVWSLLKNSDVNVQARAAAALVPCVKNAYDSGEMVRSFVGGLELIVSRLRSTDNNVVASVCAAIAQIAEDRENLAVITEHGVVSLLTSHVHTTDENVRQHLAKAIAYCCKWAKNCYEFGRLGAIRTLCSYMYGDNLQVHKSTAMAIHQLSADPYNCIELQAAGVIQFLLITIGSEDIEVQNASVGALSNMRKLALSAENYKIKKGSDLR